MRDKNFVGIEEENGKLLIQQIKTQKTTYTRKDVHIHTDFLGSHFKRK